MRHRSKIQPSAEGVAVQERNIPSATDGVLQSGWPEGLLVVGVDEAGRGPLAGPVVASAVVLDPASPIVGLKDSKQLSGRQREILAPLIRAHALAWAVTEATPAEIDHLNILKATLLAMHRAVQAVQAQLEVDAQNLFAVVDGNRLPAWPYRAQAIVKGDARVPSISAASILAKTHRDTLMRALHAEYPQYGFDEHMGYPTPLHLQRLQAHGPCAAHRRTFGPVRAAMQAAQASLF